MTALLEAPAKTVATRRVISARPTPQDVTFVAAARSAAVSTLVVMGLIGLFLLIGAWPALRQQGVKLGSTAILNLTGPETEASRSQLQAFIERWKTEKVNAVFLSGLDVTSKGYVTEIKQALPDALLFTDASATVHEASDEVVAGTKPNPYDGMLSALGLTAGERWAKKSPQLQRCVDVYEKASGTKVLGPADEKVVDGKKVQIDVAVTDFCTELSMFRTIAATRFPPARSAGRWYAPPPSTRRRICSDGLPARR